MKGSVHEVPYCHELNAASPGLVDVEFNGPFNSIKAM